MKLTLILLPLFLYCFECQAAWQATGYPGNQNWNKALLVQPQNWHQHQPQNLGLQQQQQREQKPNNLPTVFENRPKSRIQHCERSELHLHFEWPKVNQKCQKRSILARFWEMRLFLVIFKHCACLG